MIRYKFYLSPILLIASWIYVSHRKYEIVRHVPREGVRKFHVRFVVTTRKPRISEISRCIIRAVHWNCIFGKWNFIGSLGHVECRNCTLVARIRCVTNDPENIYLMLSIRQVVNAEENQVAIYLIIFFL